MFSPQLEQDFQRVMAEPVTRQVLTVDQLRNNERLKAYEEKKRNAK